MEFSYIWQLRLHISPYMLQLPILNWLCFLFWFCWDCAKCKLWVLLRNMEIRSKPAYWTMTPFISFFLQNFHLYLTLMVSTNFQSAIYLYLRFFSDNRSKKINIFHFFFFGHQDSLELSVILGIFQFFSFQQKSVS